MCRGLHHQAVQRHLKNHPNPVPRLKVEAQAVQVTLDIKKITGVTTKQLKHTGHRLMRLSLSEISRFMYMTMRRSSHCPTGPVHKPNRLHSSCTSSWRVKEVLCRYLMPLVARYSPTCESLIGFVAVVVSQQKVLGLKSPE